MGKRKEMLEPGRIEDQQDLLTDFPTFTEAEMAETSRIIRALREAPEISVVPERPVPLRPGMSISAFANAFGGEFPPRAPYQPTRRSKEATRRIRAAWQASDHGRHYVARLGS